MELPTAEKMKSPDFKYPALGFVIKHTDPPKQEIGVLRSLTDEEWKTIEGFKDDYTNADSRLSVLRIAIINYEEILAFVEAVKADNTYKAANRMIHMDRLLMNYLSAAYGVHEHFVNYFEQFPTDERRALVNETRILEENSFVFAFFRDYRNYVQHVGLPVGNMHLNHKRNGEGSFIVTYKVDSLLQKYNRWNRSKLSEKAGQTVDLIALLQQYHDLLMKHYGKHIIHHLLPKVQPFHDYMVEMNKEVLAYNPKAELQMVSGYTDDGQGHFDYNFIFVPANVLGSIGITVKPMANDS